MANRIHHEYKLELSQCTEWMYMTLTLIQRKPSTYCVCHSGYTQGLWNFNETYIDITQVSLLQGFWISGVGPLNLLLPKTFELFGFQIFWLWAYLMNVIPETCRVHWIWYLRFINLVTLKFKVCVKVQFLWKYVYLAFIGCSSHLLINYVTPIALIVVMFFHW
jgi:hypothetical protein